MGKRREISHYTRCVCGGRGGRRKEREREVGKWRVWKGEEGREGEIEEGMGSNWATQEKSSTLQ